MMCITACNSNCCSVLQLLPDQRSRTVTVAKSCFMQLHQIAAILDVKQSVDTSFQNGMQGFYVTLVYHGISIAYGGDSAIQDKDTWIADWVSLLKQVLKSDACEVS